MTRPTVAPGATGADVERVQSWLRWAGYDVAVTGTYGAETENAVRRYQGDHAMPVTGVTDEVLWDLFEHGGVPADQRTTRIESGGTWSFEGNTVKYVAYNDGEVASVPGYDDLQVHTWHQGVAGDAVVVAQTRFDHPGEIAPHTAYTGAFDLGPMRFGGYHATVRLDAAKHDSSPEMVAPAQFIEFVFGVTSDGAQPEIYYDGMCGW